MPRRRCPEIHWFTEDCLAEAMNNRYELKQSELNKELSELDMKMTKSARLPVLTGNATL